MTWKLKRRLRREGKPTDHHLGGGYFGNRVDTFAPADPLAVGMGLEQA